MKSTSSDACGRPYETGSAAVQGGKVAGVLGGLTVAKSMEWFSLEPLLLSGVRARFHCVC